MERFYTDLDKLIDSKADDLYKDCCVAIIEANNLKEKAINGAIAICNRHILDDKNNPLRDELTTLIPTVESVISRLRIKKETPTND